MRLAPTILTAGLILTILLAGWGLWAALFLPGESDVRAKIPYGLPGEKMLDRGFSPWLDCRSMVFELADGLAYRLRAIGAEATTRLPTTAAGRRYARWATTPVDPETRESWSVTGSVWQGFGCGLTRKLADAGMAAALAPGSFYTFGKDRMLLVDPARNLLFHTHTRTMP